MGLSEWQLIRESIWIALKICLFLYLFIHGVRHIVLPDLFLCLKIEEDDDLRRHRQPMIYMQSSSAPCLKDCSTKALHGNGGSSGRETEYLEGDDPAHRGGGLRISLIGG